MLLRRSLTGLLLLVWFGFVLACGGCGSREKMEKELGEANAQWDRGEKSAAVPRYKEICRGPYPNPAELELLLSRIIDFESAAGNIDAAKAWAERGIRDKVKLECKEPKAKELLAAIEKAREEEVNRRKEEERRNEERRQAWRVPAPSSPPPAAKPRKGEQGFIEADDQDTVWVAIDSRASKELVSYCVAKNEAAVRQMMSEGRVLVCERRTKVTVVDPGILSTTIRIMEGPHEGRTGVVDSEFLHK